MQTHCSRQETTQVHWQFMRTILNVDQSRNYINRVAAYSAYDVKPQQLERQKQYIENIPRQ